MQISIEGILVSNSTNNKNGLGFGSLYDYNTQTRMIQTHSFYVVIKSSL